MTKGKNLPPISQSRYPASSHRDGRFHVHRPHRHAARRRGRARRGERRRDRGAHARDPRPFGRGQDDAAARARRPAARARRPRAHRRDRAAALPRRVWLRVSRGRALCLPQRARGSCALARKRHSKIPRRNNQAPRTHGPSGAHISHEEASPPCDGARGALISRHNESPPRRARILASPHESPRVAPTHNPQPLRESLWLAATLRAGEGAAASRESIDAMVEVRDDDDGGAAAHTYFTLSGAVTLVCTTRAQRPSGRPQTPLCPAFESYSSTYVYT